MRIALFVAFAAIAPGLAAAQQPSAAQVQQALQDRPGLSDVVRSRIAQSGLTPEQVRARLIARKSATEETLKKIDQQVRAVINEAAEFATSDPEPDPSDLYTDVYADVRS